MHHIYEQPQFGENWFTFPKLYAEMVHRFPSGSRFIELGSHLGKSAAFMAVEIANSGKTIELHLVDIDIKEQLLENLDPVREYYTATHHGSTASVLYGFPNEHFDFVFIDAAHDYRSVVADIRGWLPKVKPGGVLAGHDYYTVKSDGSWMHPGVAQAVQENLPMDRVRISEGCFIFNKL